MLEKIWVINGKFYILQDDSHCTKCKDYMNCNYNQIGLGSGNWAKECIDYQPEKLQTNKSINGRFDRERMLSYELD